MSRKLHEEAVRKAARVWVKDRPNALPGPYMTQDARDLIAAYLAHLAAHGVKLTPRELTRDMTAAACQAASQSVAHVWTATHDAADWPGEE